MSERAFTGDRSDAILALGGDRTHAAAALVEPVAGAYRLVGWVTLPPPRRTEAVDGLAQRLALAAQRLAQRLGRPLWQEDADHPYFSDPEPALALALDQVVGVADPLPPLRAWVAGLAAGESLTAAQEALASAHCDVVALYRLTADPDPMQLALDLDRAAPDAVIVTGGYDRASASAQEPVLALCEVVAAAVRQLNPRHRPALFFAGNRSAAAAAVRLWQEVPGVPVQSVGNVLPAPGVVHQSSLAVALSQLYWARCQAHPALERVRGWITRPATLRSLHWSFAQAVRMWRIYQDLPHLHGIYTGPQRWMHVWAAEGTRGVRVRFVPPGHRPEALRHWPPVRFVSGPWPHGVWTQSTPHWWDPTGLLPIVANIGQVAPGAALQVMSLDLLQQG